MELNKKITKLKILVAVLILIFYGLLLMHKIDFVSDDLSRHLKNGQMVLQGNFKVLKTNFYSLTEPDYPFINDHWLSGVVFLPIYNVLGFSGLIIFKTVLLLLAFLMLFLVALKKADFWLTAALSLPVILILMERTEVRPDIFSFAFVAIFIYLLYDFEKHPDHKRIYWLVPLQLVWVNIHTFFTIGIMLVVGFLLEKIINEYKNFRQNPLIKKLLIISALMALVCLINPNGLSGALNPFTRYKDYAVYVTHEQPLLDILNNKPVEDISAIMFIPLVFILIFSFYFGFRQKKKPIFYFLASLGAVAACFSRVRLLPFFGLIFLPAVSANFNDVFIRFKDWLKKKFPKMNAALGKISILILILVLFVLILFRIQGKILSDFKIGLGLASRSNSAASFFKGQGLHGPIFNDHAIGQYLIWHLYPQEKVFFDQRGADAYSAEFVREYEMMLTQEDAWQKAMEKYQFNVISFYLNDGSLHSQSFIRRRLNDDPDWALVYADNNNLIFLRNNAENREKIRQFQITSENVEEKLSFLLDSGQVSDMRAAGDIFNLMNRGDLAVSVFQKVVLAEPKNSNIWKVMGQTLILKNDEKGDILAAIYLERAIDLGQKNAETYTSLGLVYFRLGRFNEADEMIKKALNIEPDRQETKYFQAEMEKYIKERNINL